MKSITIVFLLVSVCINIQSQNITNTLGTLGVFSIKDGSTNYLTLNQSTGQVNILRTLRLENTTSSTTGVIYKGADRFLHNYGTANTFLGISSGNFTMTGTYNSAFGYQSLSDNTTGYYNSAFGYRSLFNNSTGNSNSAFGYASLYFNSTGFQNSAVGNSTLYSNTTGYNNSAFGYYSLFDNTTGNNNSAFGTGSLLNNNTGNSNSAFGYYSLNSNTTGYDNSAVGNQSLAANTTGTYNSAVGYYSLNSNTTGSNNTAIGYNAQVPSGIANNQVRIGGTLVTYAGVQVAWTITSDRRWKDNILPSSLGLSFISKLNPVSYTRNNDENQKTEYGFIAQEIEQVLKENGVENTGMLTITDDGMYELRYNDLLAPMVKAIQELSEGLLAEKVESEKLKAENEELKTEIEEMKSLKDKITMLEKVVNEIKAKDNEIKEVKLGEKYNK